MLQDFIFEFIHSFFAFLCWLRDFLHVDHANTQKKIKGSLSCEFLEQNNKAIKSNSQLFFIVKKRKP